MLTYAFRQHAPRMSKQILPCFQARTSNVLSPLHSPPRVYWTCAINTFGTKARKLETPVRSSTLIRNITSKANEAGKPRILLPESNYYKLVPYVCEWDSDSSGWYYRLTENPLPSYENRFTSNWDHNANTCTNGFRRYTEDPEFGKFVNNELAPLMFEKHCSCPWITRRANGEIWLYEDNDYDIWLYRVHEPEGEDFFRMLINYFENLQRNEKGFAPGYFPHWRCRLGEEVNPGNFADYRRQETLGLTRAMTRYSDPPDEVKMKDASPKAHIQNSDK